MLPLQGMLVVTLEHAIAAPISTNLILSYVAEHVLGMPRSF